MRTRWRWRRGKRECVEMGAEVAFVWGGLRQRSVEGGGGEGEVGWGGSESGHGRLGNRDEAGVGLLCELGVTGCLSGERETVCVCGGIL